MEKADRIRLRAKLKGLVQAGFWARKQIGKNIKERRHEWWQVKRLIGADTRHHFIAYGLIRGLPYGAIEVCCRDDNRPNAHVVWSIIFEHRAAWTKCWTIETVRAALDPAEQAKYRAEHPQPIRVKKPRPQHAEAAHG